MSIVINGSTGIQMAADDSLEFGTVGISQDTLFSGRKNVIINGDFDVWQRGTSFGSGATAYTADRWVFERADATWSATQQSFTVGQTDVPNEPEYYIRNTVTTASTTAEQATLVQKIESCRTLAGQVATLSFWAKADSSKNIAVELFQYYGGGGSGNSVGMSVTTISLTTSWQKFTISTNIDSISGETIGSVGDDFVAVGFWLSAGSNFNARTNSLGNQSGTFDIAQVQLEKGSQATAFEKRSYGEELALCQRYYEISTAAGMSRANDGVIIAYGNFSTTKRALPTTTLSKLQGLGTGSVIQVYPATVSGYSVYQTGGVISANAEYQCIADAEL